MRDTQGWWFYWNFHVSNAAGRTLAFKFTDGNPIGVLGPAVSADHGENWSWLGADSVRGSSFGYAFERDQNDVRFCFAIPYEQRFRYEEGNSSHVRTVELCKSRKGRPVPIWRLGKLDAEPAHRILITARHHACESVANYVLDGIIETVGADTEAGKWFCENVEIMAVPFVDLDGVADGDQGKNRKPHDHNRDYRGESIYPSVRAIRELVGEWSDGKLIAAFDLHCPWIRGDYNEVIYMVGSSDPAIWRQQSVFGGIVEKVQRGTLVYRVSDNLPFGQAWNTGGNYAAGKSFSRWAAELEGVKLSTGIEIPYARANGKAVTAETAREFGCDLAVAIYEYLRD